MDKERAASGHRQIVFPAPQPSAAERRFEDDAEVEEDELDDSEYEEVYWREDDSEPLMLRPSAVRIPQTMKL